MESAEYWGYDGAARAFVRSGFDSTGAMYRLTSMGWQGDRLQWSGETVLLGQPVARRETYVRKGPREAVALSEVRLPDGRWRLVAETICRR